MSNSFTEQEIYIVLKVIMHIAMEIIKVIFNFINIPEHGTLCQTLTDQAL